MNITAITAVVALVVLYTAMRLPVATYARPKFALELDAIVTCGVIGSFNSRA